MKKNRKEWWLRTDHTPPQFRIWDKVQKGFITAPWRLVIYDENNMAKYFDPKNRYVIQECTGCKDSNTKLIYEGDILETNEFGWIGVVVYRDGQFALKDKTGGFSIWPDWEECKIVGNVYQNPELIP